MVNVTWQCTWYNVKVLGLGYLMKMDTHSIPGSTILCSTELEGGKISTLHTDSVYNLSNNNILIQSQLNGTRTVIGNQTRQNLYRCS